MIGTSSLEYLFIRVCIFVLHWIAPLSVLLCAVLLTTRPTVPLALAAWLILETAFYLLVYLPRKYYLQRPALHPELVPPEDRRRLFYRCLKSIPDPDQYLSKWFMDSPAWEIKTENIHEFLRWAFLNTQDVNEEQEQEINEYTEATENLVGRSFAPGRGSAKSLRLTFDKVNMLHRSLFWYLVSHGRRNLKSAYLTNHHGSVSSPSTPSHLFG